MAKEKKVIGAEDLVNSISKDYIVGWSEFDEKKGLTVECLCAMCIEQIAKGNAQKHIQISTDEEGNGYHKLFYGFAQCEPIQMYGPVYEDGEPDHAQTLLLG